MSHESVYTVHTWHHGLINIIDTKAFGRFPKIGLLENLPAFVYPLKDPSLSAVFLGWWPYCRFRELGNIFCNCTNKGKLSSKHFCKSNLCSKTFENISPKFAWIYTISMYCQICSFAYGKSACYRYFDTFNPVLRIRDVYPGSRILIFTHPRSRIPDPRSRIPDLGSRIPDPKTPTKERGEKKLVVVPFYVATNFTKL